MHGHGKSDRPIVPVKSPNNTGPPVAEGVEGRGLAKGSSHQQHLPIGHRAGTGRPSALERVRQAASRDRTLQFTALLHHVYHLDALRAAYLSLKRDATPGVDGETWRHDGEALEEHLRDLSARLQRGAYRAKPVRRVYLPKAARRHRAGG
jgi:RNA-directed DNA polymerase